MNQIKEKFTKKRIISAIIFFAIAFLTLYVIFKNNDIKQIAYNFGNANKFYLLIGLLCMFGYIFFESLNTYRLLRSLNDKVSFFQAIKYSIIGFFFSSITPSSTGGQPMQLYYMKKDKISISHGALALLVQLLSFQFITLVLAVLGFIFDYNLLHNHVGNIKYLMLFGLCVNLTIQTILIIMIFTKKVSQKLVNFVYKVLKKLKIKSADTFKEKSLNQLEEYHECAIYLKNNKFFIFQIFLTTILQLSVYHSVPYFVYRSFNLTEYSIFTFILMEAVLYISVASLPLPGAMGASEGGFMIMFKILFPATILSSAMLLSRGISFYLSLILSAIFIMIYTIVINIKKARRVDNNAN